MLELAQIDGKLRSFIEAQKMFFVATKSRSIHQ